MEKVSAQTGPHKQAAKEPKCKVRLTSTILLFNFVYFISIVQIATSTINDILLPNLFDWYMSYLKAEKLNITICHFQSWSKTYT